MKARKLIPEPLLAELALSVSYGVPVTVSLRQLAIDMSVPAAIKLLNHYKNPSTHASLFPSWLDSTVNSVQECPKDCKYKGYFPLGEWTE